MDGGHTGGGTEGVEGEGDQDESSSSSNLRDCSALESFRREWKKELDEKSPVVQSEKTVNSSVDYSVEDKAKVLFQLGVENEEKGNLYEAVQFYKKAFQLVPDIELRLASQQTTPIHSSERMVESKKTSGCELSSEGEDSADEDGSDSEEEFDPTRTDLISHLTGIMLRSRHQYRVCNPLHPTNGAKHLSQLPPEVILYLLRWVVGADLDLRSLEQVARVCRGFYLCARDAELWRLACTRVWGVRCGKLGTYKTWREMYIFRPRVHTGGCYISKTTYIRPGENSFQDRFYRPWHVVQYFRYFRFFADGTCLMLTASEEPVACVGTLRRERTTIIKGGAPLFRGYYRLLESNIVSIIVSPADPPKALSSGRQRHPANTNSHQSFHIELEIVSSRSRLHGQLVWRRYSLLSRNHNGVETNTNFELIPNRFPPFMYSRVKSYHSESYAPL